MTSRVVAIRFNSETVAQCLLLLQKHGIRIEGMSMSKAVKTVVETIIMQQEKNNTLMKIDSKTADVFIENHLDPEEAQSSIVSDNTFSDLLRTIAKESQQEGTGAQLAKLLTEKRIPEIAKPSLEIQEGELESDDVVRTAFWSVNHMPLADILEVAPDDPVIKKFLDEKNKEKGDPKMKDLLQRCIEIVYKQIPVSEWGKEKTHRMVNNLFQDNM